MSALPHPYLKHTPYCTGVLEATHAWILKKSHSTSPNPSCGSSLSVSFQRLSQCEKSILVTFLVTVSFIKAGVSPLFLVHPQIFPLICHALSKWNSCYFFQTYPNHPYLNWFCSSTFLFSSREREKERERERNMPMHMGEGKGRERISSRIHTQHEFNLITLRS